MFPSKRCLSTASASKSEINETFRGRIGGAFLGFSKFNYSIKLIGSGYCSLYTSLVLVLMTES